MVISLIVILSIIVFGYLAHVVEGTSHQFGKDAEKDIALLPSGAISAWGGHFFFLCVSSQHHGARASNGQRGDSENSVDKRN